ncbi:MAG TPA: hypothetical protein VJU81_02735 [Methylomirabilota bacterium]|nr:hypothetical protein [Methylomirabilota bacterium]
MGENPSSSPSTAVTALGRASDRIRETVKWIIASFAAVGAAMLAGTQLSGIGELDPAGFRMWLAIIGGALVLVGIALAVWTGSTVLITGPVALSELVRGRVPGSVDRLLQSNKVFLGGFADVDSLQAAFESATREMRAAYAALHKTPSPPQPLKDAAESANVQADLIGQVVSRLLDAASWTIVQARFKRARPLLFVGALVTATGVGLFTWAVNPPKAPKDAPATRHVAPMKSVEVVLTEEGARILGPRLGGTCDTKRLRALISQDFNTGGLSAVSVPTAACQPMRFVLTREIGSVLAP